MRLRRWLQTTPLRLRSLFRRPRVAQELDEELRYHIDRQIEAHIENGLTPEAARHAAMRAMGGIDQLKEACRDVRRGHLLEELAGDLRYGLRSLRQNPGFTAAVVLTVAVGIGANSAIFSVVEAALLRPLPFPQPDRLVAIDSINAAVGPGGTSPADFRDWSEQSTTIENVAAFSGNGLTLRDDGRTETVLAARVTSRFFDALGVAPRLGRRFSADEWLGGGPRAVLISDRLWARRFGSDPSIVGTRLPTGEVIIGVMPPQFTFPSGTDAWQPIPSDTPEMSRRSARYWRAIGRLRPAQSLASARAEMRSIGGRLAAAYPKDDKDWTVRVDPLAESLARGYRPALLILMGAVSFVLLIACANVSSLMLARSIARQREMTLKLALGAGRGRLVRQFIVEALLLSALGAAAGLLLAQWSIAALFRLLPNTSWTALVSLRDEVHLNGMVLLFAAAVSIVTGIMFAIIPAWRAIRMTIAGSLQGAGRSTQTRGEHRLQKSLVVAEIACAVVLLAGAGLLIQSFLRMQRIEYGYDPHGLAITPLLQPARNRQLFTDQVLERLTVTPGVESAAVMSFSSFGGLNFPFNIESRPLPGGDALGRYSSVSAGYFRVLRARLLAGRTFNADDSPNAPGVAIINDTLARRYFQGGSAIGQKIVIAYLNQRVVREIVGVVADIRQDRPSEPIRPEVFVHWPQLPWLGAVLVIRAHGDPSDLGKAVQAAISSVDKTVPALPVQTVEAMLNDQVAEPRLYVILLGTFAGAALLVAMMGIYGLLNYVVSRRLHEMAIRIAIGAQALDIVRSVVGEGLRLSIAGIGCGLVGAVALTRLMKGLLFNVTPTDPLTLGVVTCVLFAVAVAAAYLPARRAAMADPLMALRHE
jgi:putative ABC transport system permease protein